jgi:hypothetical protein
VPVVTANESTSHVSNNQRLLHVFNVCHSNSKIAECTPERDDDDGQQQEDHGSLVERLLRDEDAAQEEREDEHAEEEACHDAAPDFAPALVAPAATLVIRVSRSARVQHIQTVLQ